MSNTTPVPHDIPLPLPAPEWFLTVLLIGAFAVHIVFVNLMVGGSVLTLVFEWLGLRRPAFDRLAQAIARTITVNKSLAVVMGVAPLLLINTLYTVYFYSANALTGLAWILIIPLVSIAFLLTYLHKYSWERLQDHKFLHLSIACAATGILLAVPLIFLVNINLMLFPQRWGDVRGFVSALMLPNVWPRYFHFVAASLAATALFLVFYFKRPGYPWDSLHGDLPRPEALRLFYSVALIATAAQFVIGPLVFVTIPNQGVSWVMNALLFIGILFAIPSLAWMVKEILGDPLQRGRYALRIVLNLSLTVVFMVLARHAYRAKSLEAHQQQMQEKTAAYSKAVTAAQVKENKAALFARQEDPGLRVFKTYCIGCHAYGHKLVGPPIAEIQQIYRQNPEGIARWAASPGKKRPDFPPMPPIAAGEADLKAVAQYMLQMKGD